MDTSLAMVAGEASGDLLGGYLLKALKRLRPELPAYGIGGPRMMEQGFRSDWPMEKLSVHGYAEALRHYREIAGIRRKLRDGLIAEPPAAFVGIDAPDFNFGLEETLRGAGIPTLHFVSPSIWAWRGGRIKKIGRAVDHMLVLFPFEEEIYRRAGIRATYVGHPLADEIPAEPDRRAARRALGLDDADEVVALMPGSRMAEIRYIGPAFIEAARRLLARAPKVRFLTPLASPATRALFEQILAELNAGDLPIELYDGRSHNVLAACDAALVASGTATLETALFKRPMVIAYRVARLSWMLMRHMGYLPWHGLPNILAREFLVPEFIQHAATPEALADALYFQLRDTANRQRLESRFAAMHRQLRMNTSERAAEVVSGYLNGGAR